MFYSILMLFFIRRGGGSQGQTILRRREKKVIHIPPKAVLGFIQKKNILSGLCAAFQRIHSRRVTRKTIENAIICKKTDNNHQVFLFRFIPSPVEQNL